MKKYLTISVLGLAFLLIQSCGTESKKTEAPTTSLSKAERQAKVEKERAVLEEQRKIELDKLIAEHLYYEFPEGKLVYYKAEVDPKYVGGDEAMNMFLKKNLKYPEVSTVEQQEGTVFVDFIVSESGEVTDVTASHQTYNEDENVFKTEALRVVNLMPDWAPGLQNGLTVDVQFSVPITFSRQ